MADGRRVRRAAAGRSAGLVAERSRLPAPETERPAGLADLTAADSSVWNGRIGSLDASAIPEEEVNTMLAQGTRVLATREALERELPAIAECRKAAADF